MPTNRRQRQMVSMNVLETSGVDHPAHGFEGWLVRKSADSQQVTKLEALVRKDRNMTAKTFTKAELIADIRKSKASADVVDSLIKSVDLTEDVNAAASLWQSLRAKLEADDPTIPTPTDPAAPPAPQEGAPMATPQIPVPGVPADPANLFKSVTDPAIREILVKQAADNAELRKTADEALEKAAAERNIRLDAEATTLLKSTYSELAIDFATVAPALRKQRESDPAAAEAFEKALSSANGQLEAAKMFGEIGHSAPSIGSNAMAKATSIAEGFVAAGVSKTMEAGMAKAFADNPALYTEFEKESAR